MSTFTKKEAFLSVSFKMEKCERGLIEKHFGDLLTHSYSDINDLQLASRRPSLFEHPITLPYYPCFQLQSGYFAN